MEGAYRLLRPVFISLECLTALEFESSTLRPIVVPLFGTGMVMLNSNPPVRPQCCAFDSIAGLYAEYLKILAETGGVITSTCGHSVLVFDHHFFHMAAIQRPPEQTLSMPGELAEIEATSDGMGRYVLGHGGSRARNLPSAFMTIANPDEVWVDNPRVGTAKWVYIKQFDSKPYAYTVALIGERPHEGGIIVPFSSFPCKASDIKKWRKGTLLHPKQIQPPEGG